MLLGLPAGKELQSSQAPLRNTVANVSQSLMDVLRRRGNEGLMGIFP